MENEEQRIIEIYTDGSCKYPNGPGAWAYVVINNFGEIPLREEAGLEKNTTNNRMELTAIIKALENSLNKGFYKAVLYTDSMYCVKSYNSWIKKWEKKGWRRSKNKKTSRSEVKNLDLMYKMNQLKSKLPDIKVKWVKGHANNYWNNYVDALISSS